MKVIILYTFRKSVGECSVYSYNKLCLSCQVTGSHWLAHPKPQLCDYCEDIIVHIDT